MEPAKSKRIRRLACGVLLPLALLGVASAAHASLAISTAPTSHVKCSAGTCTAQAADAVLNVTKLTHLLHQGDTQVVAGAAQAIDIEAPFTWTKPSRLTLSATTGITVAQPVAVQGAGAVTMTASAGDWGIVFTGGGKLDFWDLSSSLIVNGNAYVLARDVSGLASAVAANSDGFFALASDYDAKADKRHKTSPIYALYGSLNGLGHTIANLKIESTEEYAAFVAYLVGDASFVSNLTLSDIALTGTGHDAYVGGLAGYSQGSVSHVRVTGHVNGPDGAAVGGIIAWQAEGPSTPPISVSSADVVVSGGPESAAGGIVGYNLYGSILRCAATGRIVGDYAGGLVGLAEWDFGNIVGSWSSARVTGAGIAAGLVGWADGNFTLADNYASGAVSGGGGLIGKNTGIGSSGNAIMRSYARGAVGGNGGGVTGSDDGTGVYTSVYWDLNTSGISNPAQGVGNIANEPGITGLTHAQMKSGLPAGFDPAVWGQSASINNSYPYLLANPPPQ